MTKFNICLTKTLKKCDKCTKLTAVFQNNMEWNLKDKTLNIAFLKEPFLFNNSPIDPEFTLNKANWFKKIIEDYFITPKLINFSIQWDTSLEKSDIRISFVSSLGAWSIVGVGAQTTPKNESTMNIGWLDDNNNYDFKEAKNTGIVIIHEFGHLLGLLHEHSRPNVTSLNWNKQYVYDTLKGPPNYWTQEDCDEQILTPFELNSFNGSKYDPLSCMHYYFPPEFFNDPKPNLQHVTKMSLLDIETIKQKYPQGDKIPTSIGQIYGKNQFIFTPFLTILIIIGIIIFAYIIITYIKSKI